MFKTRPCGCKGIRSCKICETNYGAWEIDKNISKVSNFFVIKVIKYNYSNKVNRIFIINFNKLSLIF